MKEPFFVVGATRSGTTLMQLLLNAHPRLAIPAETNYFMTMFERKGQTRPWRQAVDQFLALCGRRLEPPVDLDSVRATLLSCREPDFAALLDLPLSQWAANEGKARWGEKSPDHIFFAEPIVTLFPDAKIIELVRDPRAAVASMTSDNFAFKSREATRNAFYWQYVRTWGHAAVTQATGPQQRLLVRYESLVTDPERTLREVCQFLGESFDPGMLSFHERTRNYVRPWRAQRDPRLARPVSADLYAWRETLTARQLAIIEAVCSQEMRALGYQKEGRQPTPAERAEIASKRAYLAWKHHQQRDKYYHSLTAPMFGRARAIAANLPLPTALKSVRPSLK